nr:HNH endonuclease family protein [uncultured Pseudomonas sp.]
MFILLKDPASATTVFEGLNDPGIPISVGDLVKNEVFSRIGYAENEARLLHDKEWIPLREKFGDTFDDYFFPYCVIFKSSATKTEMFGELRKLWVGLDSKAIINKLDEYSLSYLTLQGITSPDCYGKAVSKSVSRLVEAKIPSSTYPFLMQLLNAYSDGKIDKVNVIGCLDALESFLVRRAICGIEPTGLLGLFRTMWALTEGRPTAQLISAIISRRLTIEWPDDTRLAASIKSRPLYGSTIAKFVILELERAHGREEVKYEHFNIEHVMPRVLSENWAVSKADHAKVRDLWANLVPLSKLMNSSVDRQAYANKREVFGQESMFASTRKLAQKYERWCIEEVEDRSENIASWACSRWRRPLVTKPSSIE